MREIHYVRSRCKFFVIIELTIIIKIVVKINDPFSLFLLKRKYFLNNSSSYFGNFSKKKCGIKK